jgi:hypothetical protein
MNNYIYRYPVLPIVQFSLSTNIFEELVHITPIYSIIPNKKICIIINSVVIYKSCAFMYSTIKTMCNFTIKSIILINKFIYCFNKAFYKAYQGTFYDQKDTLFLLEKEMFLKSDKSYKSYKIDKIYKSDNSDTEKTIVENEYEHYDELKDKFWWCNNEWENKWGSEVDVTLT